MALIDDMIQSKIDAKKAKSIFFLYGALFI